MKRMIMFAIAVLAISIFVLPVTLSLFSGQHRWYNISPQENQIPCKKCHAGVYEEMMNMEPLSKKIAGQSNSPHSYMDENCELCHRTCFNMTYNPSTGKYEKFPGFTYASGKDGGSIPGVEAHAASTIKCMDCHGIPMDAKYWNHWGYEEYKGRCFLCHGGTGYYRGKFITVPFRGYSNFISAGGFGFGTTSNDMGERAAHKQFVLDSIINPDMEDANEACIACHTKTQVKLNFNVTSSLMISVNDTYNQSASYWNVANISPGGYITYKEVKEG